MNLFLIKAIFNDGASTVMTLLTRDSNMIKIGKCMNNNVFHPYIIPNTT